MAEEVKFSARPNFEWPPKRYYNYAAYVMMFNGIVNDHDSYGIENSNGDQVILDYIKKHASELGKKPEFEFIYWPDNHPEDFRVGPDKKYKTPEEAENAKKKARADYEKELKAFLSDIDNLHAQAKTDSAELNGYVEGGYLKGFVSNEQMAKIILPAKRKNVKGWHEAVRVNSKGKSGDYDTSGKKESNGEHYRAYLAAEEKRRDMNIQVRRNGARTFVRALATTACAAVTVASVGTLLYFGGFALSSMFGSAITGVGGAVLGVGGTVVGGAMTKGFFGRFLDSWTKGKSLRKQRREFMRSYASGADKDGKQQGFKNIKQRYVEDLFLKEALEKLPADEVSAKEGQKALDNVIKNFIKAHPEIPNVKKYVYKAFNRSAFPLKPAELLKEARFYKFVTDKYDPSKDRSKRHYGFEYMIAKLGNAKSMNLNDEHSVQAHTVIAENALRDGELDLIETKDKLEELVRAKPKFEKNADNMDKYNSLMYDFSDKMIKSFDKTLFENAYRSDLVGDVKAIYERPEVKERFTNTRSGDSTEIPENAFKFINDLRTDTANGGVLNDRVGASVESQVIMTKPMLTKACEAFGRDGIAKEIPDPVNPDATIPNPEYVMMQNAISEIAGIKNKGDTHSENANIALGSITNEKVKSYLTWMRDKKLAESTHNSGSVVASASDKGISISPAIVSGITSISESTSPSEIERIKENIMVADFGTYPPTTPVTLLAGADLTKAREHALSLVQQQVNAVERKKRNDATVSALDCIRKDSFHEYKEYMEKIPKDDVAEINAEELSIVLKDFKKVQPVEMSNFLIYKLKDKVSSILQRRATGPRFDTTGGNYSATIEALQKYITNIGNCAKYGIIDEWQKNICSKAIEEKVVSAFGPYLEKLEKEFLGNVDQTRSLAENYLKEMKLGGFAEFLNSNTIEATALRDRLNRIYDATNLSDLMTADSKGAAFGSLVCANSGETQTTLRIYFMKERKDGDALYDVLRNMQEITKTTGGFGSTDDPELISATSDTESKIIGTGDANTTGYQTKSYVYMMKKLVDSFDATNNKYGTQDMSSEDMLAALLVMKKRTLAMVKSQMNQLYKKNQMSGESVSNFALRCGTEFDKINDKWRILAESIDDKVAVLQSKVATKYKGYKSCANCIANGTNYEKYASYLASQEMSI